MDTLKTGNSHLLLINSGIGNINRAVRRAGYRKDFWRVYSYLPRETRSYVPQFVAIYHAMEYADLYNIYPDEQLFPIDFETIKVDQFVYLKAFAEESGMDVEELNTLNPAIKKGAIPDLRNSVELRILRSDYNSFVSNEKEILATALAGKREFEKMATNMPDSTFGKEKVVYRVTGGDVLGTIPRKHNVRLVDLKTWNNIRGSLIRVGQRLNIYVGPNFYEPTQTIRVLNQPIPDSKLHVVQAGDTLWDISRMYEGLSIEKIKQLNKLKNNALKPGMRLRIG